MTDDRPEIHVNRPPATPRSIKTKLAATQACSLLSRDKQITLEKPPWEDKKNERTFK